MVKFTSSQVGEVLQRLRNSEINFSLSCDWKTGFSIEVSDGIEVEHVFRANTGQHSSVNAVDTLAALAVAQFPKSDFAAWYKGLVAAPNSDVSENTPQTA